MALKARQSRKLAEKPASGVRETKRKQATSYPLLHPMTMEASAILCLAIMTAWLWNYMRSDQSTLLQQQSFIDLFCRQPDASCLGSMRAIATATGTTIEAKQAVRKGSVILKIPRRLQIWDKDALGDHAIQKILDNLPMALDNAAILALFLARKQRVLREDQSFRQQSILENPVLVDYLLYQLPTYEQFEGYHPVLWDDSTLGELLSRSSLSFSYIKDMQRVIHEEYASLSDHVDRKDYFAARLSVLTRSFGTTASEDNGSYAMVPILDSFDHQTPPNVGFTTHANGDFIVTALASFRGKIHDNYGKRSDPNLFARYGFINGDGMEHTQAGINLWHPVQQEDTASSRAYALTKDQYSVAILRYLQYDDGYTDCVAPAHNAGDPSAQDAWRLKQLKYRFLLHRSHSLKHWVITMSPRNKERKSGIPELDPSRLQFNGTTVFSTCRVLSLTHDDYDGEASTMIESHILDLDYILPATRDALEFRTLFCMSRLATTAMERFATTIELEKDMLAKLEHGSVEWMAAHLRLGELQTLQALKHVSFSKLRSNFGDGLLGSSPAYSMRNQPCPKELLMPLLDSNEK